MSLEEQKILYADLLYRNGEYAEALDVVGPIDTADISDFDTAVLISRIWRMCKFSAEQRIELLERIVKMSYEEDCMLELAVLYASADSLPRAKRVCRQIILFFHNGKSVETANRIIEIIERGEPLPDEYMQLAFPKTIETVNISEKTADETVTETKSAANSAPLIIAEAFAGIIGMDAVKNELIKFYNLVRFEKARAEHLDLSGNDNRSYNFVLYGNPGTGKTTVARIIGKLLFELGIRENDKFIEVDRSKLVGGYVGQTAIKTLEVIESAKGGTLFIDEAYSLYKKDGSQDYGQEAIDTLLKHMEDNRDNYSVIIAGYKRQMTEMLNYANPGFRSRFTYHIELPDFTDVELLAIVDNLASEHHYTIDAAGYEAIKKRINIERIDETFGNARFIRELFNEAESNLANRLAMRGEFSKKDLTVLRAEDIFLDAEHSEDLNALLKRLDGLTGLTDVKRSVHEFTAKIAVQKETERRNITGNFVAPSLHMVFKGSAGTGKTTVARLLGKILGGMGVLKRGNVFVECSRVDLVGQYMGQTAPKVKEMVRSALGGVLFIDEAYSLKLRDDDSFGQEAVDTLVAEIENHRDALVVILAGYTTDMDRFLASNQGLRSRITQDLLFEDYTPKEMTEIFFKMVKQDGFIIDDKLRLPVEKILTEKSGTPNFGNGRGVRNVYEAVVRKKDSRLARKLLQDENVDDDALITITEEDLQGG